MGFQPNRLDLNYNDETVRIINEFAPNVLIFFYPVASGMGMNSYSQMPPNQMAYQGGRGGLGALGGVGALGGLGALGAVGAVGGLGYLAGKKMHRQKSSWPGVSGFGGGFGSQSDFPPWGGLSHAVHGQTYMLPSVPSGSLSDSVHKIPFRPGKAPRYNKWMRPKFSEPKEECSDDDEQENDHYEEDHHDHHDFGSHDFGGGHDHADGGHDFGGGHDHADGGHDFGGGNDFGGGQDFGGFDN